jgi:hypothetical protein
MILKHKTWKIGHSIFHLLQFWLPNSTYYAIEGQTWKMKDVSPTAAVSVFNGTTYINI